MIAPEQIISEELRLVKPDIERDAPLSVEWRSGETGHATQVSMGVAPDGTVEPSLEEERALIKKFIETEKELVWMIGDVSDTRKRA